MPKPTRSSGSKPSAELLLRFYGRMLGRSLPDEELYAGVPFETFYRLQQIYYPLITPRTAATNARLAKYKELAPDLPDDAIKQPSVVRRSQTVSGKTVDLRVAEIAAGIERLDVDRAKDASGWPTLKRLKKLQMIATVLCKTQRFESIEPPLALDELEIRESNLETVKTLLSGTRCRKIRIEHAADPVLDLAPLAEHHALVELRAGASLVRNLDAVVGRPFTVLALSTVAPSDSLQRCLDAPAPTQTRLSLGTSAPLSPKMMPSKLPRLTRFDLGVHASEEDAWLAYASRRPDVAFQFHQHAKVQRSAHAAEVEDVHRGVDIIRIARGKKVHYEVSGDLATTFGFDDNAELEDAARDLAKTQKRRLRWSSEHDTFVAMAASADDLRWLIDALHASAS